LAELQVNNMGVLQVNSTAILHMSNMYIPQVTKVTTLLLGHVTVVYQRTSRHTSPIMAMVQTGCLKQQYLLQRTILC
jgi:hypothetical protein